MMLDVAVKNMTMDSRQVKPGDLFIAVPGLTVDGREFIEQAVTKGAVAVLAECDSAASAEIELKKQNKTIPIIAIPKLQKLVGHIAARFFNHPSRNMPVIGITGTNGKTSISHFIAQILSYCRKPCGIIGSLGAGVLGNSFLSHEGTTPDPIAVQRILSNLQNQQAVAVAMEVTSHALAQNRVEGVEFHTTLFTNLTRDHLDYHPDMEAYGEVKKKLFTEFQSQYSVINIEDKFGLELFRFLKQVCPERKLIGYTTGVKGEGALVSTQKLILDNHGIKAFIKTPWGEGELQCNLLGRFNLSNLLAAIAAVCIQGIPLAEVLQAVQSIKPVPGRMTRFGGNHEMPLVIVDYAHKPDALAQVLEALRTHCTGRLWCVVGCGGDRDRGKRPIMAEIGERLSDYLYLTQDNPRTEDPKQIMAEMLEGLKHPKKAIVEYDRKKAIELTIAKAKPKDIVVIAGKGHEDYQIIGTEKIPFSDQIVVEAALKRRTA